MVLPWMTRWLPLTKMPPPSWPAKFPGSGASPAGGGPPTVLFDTVVTPAVDDVEIQRPPPLPTASLAVNVFPSTVRFPPEDEVLTISAPPPPPLESNTLSAWFWSNVLLDSVTSPVERTSRPPPLVVASLCPNSERSTTTG